MQGHSIREICPQGSLEIPFQLTFEGNEQYINEVKKLMKLSDTDSGSLTVLVVADTAGNSGSSNSKEAYVQVEDDDDNDGRKVDDVWLRVQNVILRPSDKAVLLNGELNDKVINVAQKLLQQKFPSLQGS